MSLDPSPKPPAESESTVWLGRLILSVAVVAVGAGLVAGWHKVGSMIRHGRQQEALRLQYARWSLALNGYTSTDPIQQDYGRRMAIYYHVLAQKYTASIFRPWEEDEPLLVAPERPETLPGAVDPVTGAPPELATALQSLAGPDGADPGTFAPQSPR